MFGIKYSVLFKIGIVKHLQFYTLEVTHFCLISTEHISNELISPLYIAIMEKDQESGTRY